jgi:hypothetical protein
LNIKVWLKELIEELDRIHPEGFFNGEAWRVDEGLPDFVTAQNGHERHFTKKARTALHAIAVTIHESDPGISSIIEISNFNKMLRQCVADAHADALLDSQNLDDARKHVNEQIKLSLAKLQTEFTHYFPAWTLGMEHERPFVFGPVTIMTRDQWIDSVEFPQHVLDRYFNTPEVNANWKAALRDALANKDQGNELGSLAAQVYSAIKGCPSILKIRIKGYEHNLSRKVGEIVCKTALDSISLLFGGREFFHQQALSDERLQPVEMTRILETGGRIWMPGTSLGPRIRHLSYPRVSEYLKQHAAIVKAFERILEALVDPGTANHPNLAKRWATALDWMAEGSRDKNDAVALAKIASSLDVLACGGRAGGILKMVEHLTKLSPSTVVVNGLKPRTLKAVIEEIYNYGRSQILHGTHFDRLKSFEETKSHAAFFARLALIECAMRLEKFTGPDGDKEFRTMPD